jgi:hypothetical protein
MAYYFKELFSGIMEFLLWAHPIGTQKKIRYGKQDQHTEALP